MPPLTRAQAKRNAGIEATTLGQAQCKRKAGNETTTPRKKRVKTGGPSAKLGKKIQRITTFTDLPGGKF